MINDYVAVKIEKERATESGILIADSNKSDRPQTGTVMYMDYDISRVYPELKDGSKIIFGGWYDPITLGDEELYIVNVEDIKAIL